MREHNKQRVSSSPTLVHQGSNQGHESDNSVVVLDQSRMNIHEQVLVAEATTHGFHTNHSVEPEREEAPAPDPIDETEARARRLKSLYETFTAPIGHRRRAYLKYRNTLLDFILNGNLFGAKDEDETIENFASVRNKLQRYLDEIRKSKNEVMKEKYWVGTNEKFSAWTELDELEEEIRSILERTSCEELRERALKQFSKLSENNPEHLKFYSQVSRTLKLATRFNQEESKLEIDDLMAEVAKHIETKPNRVGISVEGSSAPPNISTANSSKTPNTAPHVRVPILKAKKDNTEEDLNLTPATVSRVKAPGHVTKLHENPPTIDASTPTLNTPTPRPTERVRPSKWSWWKSSAKSAFNTVFASSNTPKSKPKPQVEIEAEPEKRGFLSRLSESKIARGLFTLAKTATIAMAFSGNVQKEEVPHGTLIHHTADLSIDYDAEIQTDKDGESLTGTNNFDPETEASESENTAVEETNDSPNELELEKQEIRDSGQNLYAYILASENVDSGNASTKFYRAMLALQDISELQPTNLDGWQDAFSGPGWPDTEGKSYMDFSAEATSQYNISQNYMDVLVELHNNPSAFADHLEKVKAAIQ